MRFTLRQLGYFVAAGEYCSVRKASEAINVSQPSISAAISSLENDIGVKLFVRHHAQGLSLTTAGEHFLRAARQLINHAQEVEHQGVQLSSEVAGPLEVQCFNPLAPLVIPGICHRFQQANPEVTLGIREGHQAKIVENLRSGRIDLALTYDLDLVPEFEFEALANMPPYVLLPGTHPLADRPRLQIADLTGIPFILLDLPKSREYFLGLFQHESLSPDIRFRSSQIEVVRGLVAHGYGFSLANVQPSNMRSLDGSELIYIPLLTSKAPLKFGILKPDSNSLPFGRRQVCVAFEKFVRDQMVSGRIPGTR